MSRERGGCARGGGCYRGSLFYGALRPAAGMGSWATGRAVCTMFRVSDSFRLPDCEALPAPRCARELVESGIRTHMLIPSVVTTDESMTGLTEFLSRHRRPPQIGRASMALGSVPLSRRRSAAGTRPYRSRAADGFDG